MMKFELRHLMAAALLAGAGVIGTAETASASIVTFDFDDANNGWKHYTSQGYTYNPINLNNSTRCYDDSCFLEVTQGDPTAMYHSGAADGGSTDPDEAPASDDGIFDMLSFHFNFQGEGGNPNDPPPDPSTQSLTLYDENGGPPTTTIQLGDSYDGTGDFTIYLASDGSLHTGEVVKQVGYFVVFNNDLFDGITEFTWDATETAQVRIDCVSISPDGMNIDPGDLTNCAPSMTVIPVAPALPLMASALGILAILGRRKRFNA